MITGIKGKFPKIDESVFVAEGTQLIGDLIVEKDCSIWYNTVIRADVGEVRIGEGSNIQDGTVIHVGYTNGTYIGKGVTVGHKAIVHGATVGDYTLVGMGAIILEGAKIGKHCIIGAGALVTGNTVIEEGMLVLGSPAKMVKPLTKGQIESLYDSASHYIELSKEYQEQQTHK